MTATHSGFLEAIIANPSDDTHRLIYADWLEDHEEANRAAFIRLQCELASMEHPQRGFLAAVKMPGGKRIRKRLAKEREARWNMLRKRELELFDADETDWTFEACEGIPPRWLRGTAFIEVSKSQVQFRRGFVSAVQTDSAGWLKHGPTVAKAQPLESVVLTDWAVLIHSGTSDSEPDQFEMMPRLYGHVQSWSPAQLRDKLHVAGYLQTRKADAASALSAFSRMLILWGRG